MGAPVRNVVDRAHMSDRGLRVVGKVRMSWRGEEQTEEEDASLELSLGPVIHFLQSALKNKNEGDSRHYKLLVQQIACKKDQDTLLRVYLGLAQCVELLCERPESYKELVLVLFRFDWDQPKPIVDAYHKLLSQLVSANSTYVLPVLHSIVRILVPEDGGKVHAYERIQYYAHRSLAAVLTLAPSGISKLFSVLSRQYPHKRLPPMVQEGYCRQLLSVAAYVPLIESRVLHLIVQRALEIDVEIKITDTGDTVRDTTADDGVFDMDDVLHGPVIEQTSIPENVDEMAQKLDVIMLVLFEYLQANLGGGIVVTDNEHEISPPVILRNGVSKNPKDAQVAMKSPSPFPASCVNRQKRLCGVLLGVFEDSILLTHQSKFVQYIIFYAGGLSSEFCGKFVNCLLKICFDEEKAVVARQSGVAYLASYLARAAYVEKDVLSSALTSILEWIMQYLSKYNVAGDLSDNNSTNNNNTKVFNELGVTTSTTSFSHTPLSVRNGEQYLLFYPFCQAAFYIMCFHVDKLCDHARFHMHEWTRILVNPLNPLRHCLSTVRWEFSRLCEVYLHDDLPEDLLNMLKHVSMEGEKASNVILKPAPGGLNCDKGGAMNFANAWRNKLRYRGGTCSLHVGGGGGFSQEANPLDFFFPFDPYLLKRSHVYLEGLYCYWNTRKIVPRCFRKSDDHSEEDSSSSESDADEDAADENGIQYPNNGDNDSISNEGLPNSLIDGMSLTPESCSSILANDFSYHSHASHEVGEAIPMSFTEQELLPHFYGRDVSAIAFGDDSAAAVATRYNHLRCTIGGHCGRSPNDDHEFHHSVISSKTKVEKERSQPATSYTSVEDDGW